MPAVTLKNRFGFPRRIKSSCCSSPLAMIPTREALRFQHTTAKSPCRSSMVDVGVAGYQNKCRSYPSQVDPFPSRDIGKTAPSKAGGPVMRRREKVAIRLIREIALILLPKRFGKKIIKGRGIISRIYSLFKVRLSPARRAGAKYVLKLSTASA